MLVTTLDHYKLTAIRAPNRATVDVSVFALLEESVGVAVGAGIEYVVVVVLFWASTPEASIRATRRREKIAITMESLELTIVIAVFFFGGGGCERRSEFSKAGDGRVMLIY